MSHICPRQLMEFAPPEHLSIGAREAGIWRNYVSKCCKSMIWNWSNNVEWTQGETPTYLKSNLA